MSSPLEFVDRCSKPLHALHVVLRGSSLHDNLLSFLLTATGRPVRMSTMDASLYLSFPILDQDCMDAMRERLAGTDGNVERVLHSLCEPCAVVCARSLLMQQETHEALMRRMEGMSSRDQLATLWEPIAAASLPTVPCELPKSRAWDASKALYSSAYLSLQGQVQTLSDRHDYGSIRLEHILLGHAEFQVVAWIDEFFKQGSHHAFAFPVYACNYLQDEERYELHALMLAGRREEQIVWLIDPNGVCPDSFGEPNAVFVSLPWTKA